VPHPRDDRSVDDRASLTPSPRTARGARQRGRRRRKHANVFASDISEPAPENPTLPDSPTIDANRGGHLGKRLITRDAGRRKDLPTPGPPEAANTRRPTHLSDNHVALANPAQEPTSSEPTYGDIIDSVHQLAPSVPAAGWTTLDAMAASAMASDKTLSRWQKVQRQRNRNVLARTFAELVYLAGAIALLVCVAVVTHHLKIDRATTTALIAATATTAAGSRAVKRWLDKRSAQSGDGSKPGSQSDNRG
jgi:hypothetical protein